MRTLLREVQPGERIQITNPPGCNWRRGSVRQGCAHELFRDASGYLHMATVVQWAHVWSVLEVRNFVSLDTFPGLFWEVLRARGFDTQGTHGDGI